MVMSFKQRKIKFKPGKKLNHNIDMDLTHVTASVVILKDRTLKHIL